MIDENGIRISPYQTLPPASAFAATSKPEFHCQPSCVECGKRLIAKSTHSPCGDTSNSLYCSICMKSSPIKASATSQFHSSFVSVDCEGSGFRKSGVL